MVSPTSADDSQSAAGHSATAHTEAHGVARGKAPDVGPRYGSDFLRYAGRRRRTRILRSYRIIHRILGNLDTHIHGIRDHIRDFRNRDIRSLRCKRSGIEIIKYYSNFSTIIRIVITNILMQSLTIIMYQILTNLFQ